MLLDGDVILHDVASILKRSVRSDDVVIRWGGEEFLITLRNCPKSESERLAQRLLDNVRDYHNEESGGVTISIGGATLGKETLEEFFNIADIALYLAKSNGRDQYLGAGLVVDNK